MTSIRRPDLKAVKLRLLKTFSREPINELLRGVSRFVQQEHADLAEEQRKLLAAPPDDVDEGWLNTVYDDDHYFLDETEKLSHELAIVALYKLIEITSKRAVKTAFPDAPDRQLFNLAKLAQFLRTKGIDVTTFRHYVAMDEVRCINNSVKHNGFVNDELSAYGGWIAGKPLENLDRAYYRLVPECESYLAELIDALIASYEATTQSTRTNPPV